MAKHRDPRRGLLSRWFHRLRWLRRVLFIGGVVGGVAAAVQRRSGGGTAGGAGGAGDGPGGSGRPAPIGGGPGSPRRSAAVTAPSDDDAVTASSAPSAVRTLVSVPPLADEDDDAVGSTSGAVVVSLDGTELESTGEDAGGDTGAATPVLTVVGDGSTDDESDSERGWAPPLDDGSCPSGYPIKANDNSGIYHVPGGRSYNRTVAERCYPTADAAEADGYRPAKA